MEEQMVRAHEEVVQSQDTRHRRQQSTTGYMFKRLAGYGILRVEILSRGMKRSVRKFDGQTRLRRWPAHTYFEDHNSAMVLPNPCYMHSLRSQSPESLSGHLPQRKVKYQYPTVRYNNTVPYCIFVSIRKARVCLSPFWITIATTD